MAQYVLITSLNELIGLLNDNQTYYVGQPDNTYAEVKINALYDSSANSIDNNIDSINASIPGPPQYLNAQSDSSNSITLTYGASSGIVTGYDISANPYPTGNIITVSFPPPNTTRPSYTLIGLSSETLYNIFLYGTNANGSSPSANIITGTIPKSPTNLIGISTMNTITVSYTPNGNIHYYKIFAVPTTSGASIVANTYLGPATNYTIQSLLPGYVYNITLYGNNSVFGQTLPVSLTYGTNPSPPTGLNSNMNSENSIRLLYTAPYGNIAFYSLSQSTTIGSTIVSNTVSVYNNSSYDITNLLPGHVYDISLVACSIYGNSNPSTKFTWGTRPSPPTGLTANAINTTSSIGIHYVPPYGNISGYNLSAVPTKDNGNSVNTVIPTVIGNSYTISNLSPGYIYNIRLVSNNQYGNSIASSLLTYGTVPNPPSNITKTDNTTSTIGISYTEPSGNIVGYDVSAVPTKVGGNIVYLTDIPTGNAYTISNLSPGYVYNIGVVSKTLYGNSTPSNAFTYGTVPNPPSNVTKTVNTTSTIGISYTEPSGNISGYSVSALPTMVGGNIVNISNIPTGNTYTISNLSPGYVYNIGLVSNTPYGNSTPSNAFIYGTVPNPPTNIIKTDNTTSTIGISYTEPLGNIVGYDVSAVPTKVGGNIVYLTDIPTGNAYTISNLSPGYVYNIGLVSKTLYGNSIATSPFTYGTVPNPPTNIIKTVNTTSTIGISYTEPSGNIAGYSVSALPTMVGGNIVNISNIPTGNTYTISNLSPGYVYNIGLVSNTPYGNSIASSSLTYGTVPNPPTNIIKTDNTTSTIGISYTEPLGNIVGYDVSAVPTKVGGNVVYLTDIPTGNAYTISNLSPGYVYNIGLVSKTLYGNSIVSSPFTYGTVPTPPSNVNSNINTNTTQSIKVYFTPTVGNIQSYSINVLDIASNNTNTNTINNILDTSFNVTGLNAGNLYSISMNSNTNYGNSIPSSELIYATLPNSPTNINAINNTDTSIYVSFTPPNGNIVSYSLTTVDQNNNTIITKPIYTDTSYNITGLQSGYIYNMNIIAYTNYGNSTPSNSFIYGTVPTPPTNVTATSVSNSIILSNIQQFGNVTSYSISANSLTDGTVITNTYPASSTYTINGLATDTSYNISLYAINPYGTSYTPYTLLYKTSSVAPTISSANSTSNSITILYTNLEGITQYDISAVPTTGSTIGNTFASSPSTLTGLQPATEYTIYLYGKNAYGQTTTISYLWGTLSNTPANLLATNSTQTNISISYTNQSGTGTLNGYDLNLVSIPSGNNLYISSINSSPYTINGLLSGYEYSISLYGNTKYGLSSPSTVNYGTIPIAPTGLLSDTNTTSSIRLLYTPTPSGNITAYQLVTSNSISGTTTSNIIPDTSYNITGLQAGYIYNITLSAMNSYKMSANTAFTWGTISNPPTSLARTASNTNSISISYTKPIGNINGFNLTAIPTLVGGNTINSVLIPNGTSYVISNLSAGYIYNITLNALSVYGNSAASTTLTYGTLPNPPTNLSVTSTGNTISVSYTEPSGNILSYNMQTIFGVSTVVSNNTYSAPVSTVTVGGLYPGNIYTMALRANTAYGDSVYSNIPYGTVPTAPIMYANTANATSISVRYTQSTGTNILYDISALSIDGGQGNFIANVSTFGNTIIPGLTPGYTYNISAVAKNIYKTSVSSNILTYGTVLSPPTNLSATSTRNDITLSYTAPAGNVTAYDVSAIPISGGTTVFNTYTAPASSYTIANLVSGNSYNVYITAKNTYGRSVSANIIYSTLLPPPPPVVTSPAISATTFTSGSDTYKYYMFVATGSNQTTGATESVIYTMNLNLDSSTTFDYLVVGGGGSSGPVYFNCAGAGGGGDVKSGNITLSSGSYSYSIRVGGGGRVLTEAGTMQAPGNSYLTGNGTPITANGGINGNGGSGFGTNYEGGASGNGNAGATTKNSYNSTNTQWRGAGGGAGSAAAPEGRLNGGYGISNNIIGNSIIYGAGGGGGWVGGGGGVGEQGKGGITSSGGITTAGNGEYWSGNYTGTRLGPTNGQNNTGSGGGATTLGGSGSGPGGSTYGGSGVVVVRFKNPTW